ncbi:MAG: FAD-dependent oxidoreductase [Janthinobacterium lividum]
MFENHSPRAGSAAEDKQLGMDRPILRRDIVDGHMLPDGPAIRPEDVERHGATQLDCPESDYPPALTGMRGSGCPRAFRAGHALREGRLFSEPAPAVATGETYDLIVVGGGISGLSAAYFFQKKHGWSKRVLVLDNHDDFGGHAKRNETTVGGRTVVSNAGSFNIYSPQTAAQKEVFGDLGIDVEQLVRTTMNTGFYRSHGMGQSVFFDKETFGVDRLLKDPANWTDFTFLYSPNVPDDAEARWADFLRDAPLPERVRQDVYRLYHDKKDYLPHLGPAEKEHALERMSYERYLVDVVGCDPMVCTYLRDRTFGSGRGLDSTTALSAHRRFGLPGFAGLGLAQPAAETGQEYHFPEGNATIARLLVRKLVPGSLSGRGLDDYMTQRVDYSTLDRAANASRIRLNATVVKVLNVGAGEEAGVRVTYSHDGVLHDVTSRSCVLACWFHIVPYLCPEMPEVQKEALNYNVHTPNLWVNVWLRNWKAFQKAGVVLMNAPTSYYASIILEQPVSVAGYEHAQDPDQPTVVTMLRGYVQPGLQIKDQFRMGRIEMYETTLETYERELRRQLGSALGPYGFDPAEDIVGITVNRWGHGYSYWYSPLYDPFLLEGSEPPHLRARKPFGRITIANTDSGGTDSTALAIDMAHRAVADLDTL